MIYITVCLLVHTDFINLQITACKQQTPYGVFLFSKLLKNNFFVNLCYKLPALQKFLHNCFCFGISSLDQGCNHFIRTGVDPVWLKFSFFQKTGNRPWVVHFFLISKRESIIPVFYLFFLRYQSIFLKCMRNFILSKAKLYTVFL